VIRHIDSRPSVERPTCQWEPARNSGPAELRLFGLLRRRDLALVVDLLQRRCRSPRDLVCVDFEEVEHADYRALPEFARSLLLQRDRGASIWVVGLSPYLRALFQVAGQGPALAKLEWRESDPEGMVRKPEPQRAGALPRLDWSRAGT
jgi:ABC-type transporter Mla MlaB component